MRVVVATGNRGKLRELAALLVPLGVALVPQSDFGIEPPPETGATFLENALIKARHAARITQLPAIADDSGLEVDALGGAPGVHSARYSPQPGANDADRRQYLLQQLAALGQPQPWTARFVSVVCLAFPDGTAHFAEGECRGEIIPHERGSGGFGYDALFVVEGTGKTMAELSFEDKNQLSHRARAVQGLRARLALL